MLLVTNFSNPCTASTWPRPLCGPLPLAEVWTGTGNRTVSGEVRRWRYLSRTVTMSRDWPQIVTSCCTRMLSPSRYISSDLLLPFPDFLKFRSEGFHLSELHSIHQFLIMCYISENCYTAVTSVHGIMGTGIPKKFSYLRPRRTSNTLPTTTPGHQI